MFITNSRSGYMGTEQYASGLFLMIFINQNAEKFANGNKPLRALVRKVGMRQSGHFMTAFTTLLGVRFHLSGTYGSDGLPIDVTEYKRPGAPEHPGSFETKEECDAHYAAVNAIPWAHVERAPGLWDRLHEIPPELVQQFWAGGGHNGAGSEGPALREWALANVDTLKHLKGAK